MVLMVGASLTALTVMFTTTVLLSTFSGVQALQFGLMVKLNVVPGLLTLAAGVKYSTLARMALETALIEDPLLSGCLSDSAFGIDRRGGPAARVPLVMPLTV